MPIDDATFSDALGEKRVTAGDELPGQPPDFPQGIRGTHLIGVGGIVLQLIQVLRPPRPHSVDGALGGDRASAFGHLMKASQHARNSIQMTDDRFTAIHQESQPGGIRMATHDDDRFGWAT